MHKCTKKGLFSIAAHEACYLYAYKDAVGVWTKGFGSTKNVNPGDKLTLDQAFKLFFDEIKIYEKRVNRAVGHVINKPHEFDALVSFDYNTGAIFKGSVDDKLRKGVIDKALNTLVKYNKGKGRVLTGLVKRRTEEINMFRKGIYPDRKIYVKRTPFDKGYYINISQVPFMKGVVTYTPTVSIEQKRHRHDFIGKLFDKIKDWI